MEKIVPLDESDGQVRILDGSGMCPGGEFILLRRSSIKLDERDSEENMDGNHNYVNFLREIDFGSEKQKLVSQSFTYLPR